MGASASEEATRLIAASEADSLAGQTIGPYKILEKLGAGGMGEVYLALHARTNRRVALKLLPAFHAKNREHVERFQQEARTLLALNHPNIVTIYDVECVGDANIIASEFIQGETLRNRVARAPLTFPEALDVAIQTAAALAAAHQTGVVHRDIKPENIMLRPDGYAKVLDFGLAKLIENRVPTVDSNASTIVQFNTRPGMVMGTVHYMSPEQARGFAVDERTDIWSLGVTLYEMLTGHLPFAGETKSDVMAAILEKEPPPLARYWPEAPDALEWIVARALTKDKEERYQTAKELLADLKRLRRRLEYEAEAKRSSSATSTGLAPIASDALDQRKTWREKPPATAEAVAARTMSRAKYIVHEIKRHKRGAVVAFMLLCFVLAIIGFGFYINWTKPAPSLFQTMQISRLADTSKATDAAISPDGNYVVYVKEDAGRQSIWLKQTTASSSMQIAPPPAEGLRYGAPQFSREGDYIYYLKTEQTSPRAALYRLPTLGGDERRLIEDVSLQDSNNNFSLSPDGKQLAFIRLDEGFNRSLVITNLDGSNERKLLSRQLPEFLTAASWSPDGKFIACIAGIFGSRGVAGGQRTLLSVRVADGEEKLISPQKWAHLKALVWLPDSSGLVVAAAEKPGMTQLWHLSYPDGASRRITNDLSEYTSVSLTADASVLVGVQVNQTLNIWTAAPHDEKTPTTDDDARQLTFGVSRHDGEYGISWTPDGKIVYSSLASGNPDIWSVNADGTGHRQLTSGAGNNSFPSVSPDGRYILFNSDRSGEQGIWRMDMDGSNLKQLTNEGVLPYCTPDGQWVFYYSAQRLWKVSIDGGARVQLTTPAKDKVTAPVLSPDGEYIACNYLVGEPGAQFRVGIIPIEGGEPLKVFNVLSYAIKPLRWIADSRAVTYIDTRDGVSNIWALLLDGGPPTQMTNFKTDFISSFDWSRDGRRLALSRGSQTSDVVLITDLK